MRLATPGKPHLTYCSNIHPGESWSAISQNLQRYVPAVKLQVAPDQPFGIGLRLSAAAAGELEALQELHNLRSFLADHGLYVFTLNGFAYGPFHGTRVKQDVYLPDWMDEERLAYTNRLANLLAVILPDGVDGSISTVPGAFKPRVRGEHDAARMARLLIRHLAELHRIYEKTGKLIALALEPEPCCYLETVADTIAFFQDHLFTIAAVRDLCRLTGMGTEQAERFLRRHAGLCFDACHMAVEFEDPVDALNAFQAAGIQVCKIQLSAGLRLALPAPGKLEALRQFDDGQYLHQVIERRETSTDLVRYQDLADALSAASDEEDIEREWRIHVHVPVYQEFCGPFHNTQEYLQELLGKLHKAEPCPHLEVETYTWSVLPEAHRQEDIVSSIVKELQWVIEQLSASSEISPLSATR